MNTDDILLAAIKAVLESNHSLRLGQAVYNAAWVRYPDAMVSLNGTDVDPFYDNSRIRVFLDRLAESVVD